MTEIEMLRYLWWLMVVVINLIPLNTQSLDGQNGGGPFREPVLVPCARKLIPNSCPPRN